jgi:predicted AAA+ superfamily ATPase
MYERQQNFAHAEKHSFFFWGPRQTGKSTLLKTRYKNSLLFDLLMNDVFQRFLRNPSLLREIILAEKPKAPVIIDEIQKIPSLLDEIHWLIENTETQFILSGSSPRKILKQGVNLLGGRALRYELLPLSSTEIPDFNLIKALNAGLIPRHYDAKNPEILLAAYIGSYLEDEIIAETRIRNAQIFSKFLEKAAFSNGEILNYTNIAADCGVSSPVIKEYFNILNQSMIGTFVEVFRKKPKRRVISSPKFYFFDVGIVNFLLKRKNIEQGTESFGLAFEHFIYHELSCHSHYSGLNYPISFWRTSSQFEVDFILGDHEVAIEVKSTDNVQNRHLKGLLAFSEEYEVKHKIVVSNDPYPRLIGDIRILPWQKFIKALWDGELISN